MVDTEKSGGGALAFLATLGIGALIKWAISYIKGYFDRKAQREALKLAEAERREEHAAEAWDAHKDRMAAHKAREATAPARRLKAWEKIRPEPKPLDPNPYDED